MKTLLILSSALVVAGLAWPAGADEPTPAERAIAAAEEGLAETPDEPRLHNALAYACARRARETADPVWYERADAGLARSLELAPGNLEARRLQAWNLLGVHELAAALERAQELRALVPDDVMFYGLLVDACVELGNYAAAEEYCQWMRDLRPGNLPALLRTSYLRELFGDIEGEVEVMLEASIVERRATKRSVHRSQQALEKDVRAFRDSHNGDPKPFIWTKTADQILDNLKRYVAKVGAASGGEGQALQAAEPMRRTNSAGP
jgi:tetratricopeptide (TPR) repeat protein